MHIPDKIIYIYIEKLIKKMKAITSGFRQKSDYLMTFETNWWLREGWL